MPVAGSFVRDVLLPSVLGAVGMSLAYIPVMITSTMGASGVVVGDAVDITLELELVPQGRLSDAPLYLSRMLDVLFRAARYRKTSSRRILWSPSIVYPV